MSLRRLPAPQMEAVVLVGIGGLTYHQAARALNRPDATVLRDLRSGLTTLHELIAGSGPARRPAN